MPRRRGTRIRITLRSRWQDCSAGSANQIRPARYEHPATTPSESGGVMTVLFNQHWEVSPGKHQAYSNFILTHYNSTLERIGIKVVGGYYVTVRLMAFVTNYHNKILVPTGRVKIDEYQVQTGLWKFNQYWNIIPGAEKEYSEFVASDHIPTLEKVGLEVTAGWRVVVGSGPYILSECSAASLIDIARAIDSDEYRKIGRASCRERV